MLVHLRGLTLPLAYFFTKNNLRRGERDGKGKFVKFYLTLDYFFDKAKRKIEHYRKVSEAHKGKKPSQKELEHLRKIGLKKGNIPWNKGLRGEEYIKHFGGKHSMLGKKHSEESKRKMSLAHKGVPHPWNEAQRKKIPIAIKKALKGKKCPWVSERNKRPEFVAKVLKSLQKRPTSIEKRFIDIIQKHSLPFEYVGNGRRIIGSRCPDFVHSQNPKKVIEVFGTYFHSPEVNKKVHPSRTYSGTTQYYSQHGVDCLIFWDHELENEQAVVDTVRRWC